ncbi:unnamed protein product [Linum tenue]|uniref:HXXXD-type acyl-transferase family protein n=3 Tax=Linum tenue TaxID=586396 RepID=A0AAV0J8G1_9ROSI|nr:unnamed protein product [Linum tenue]
MNDYPLPPEIHPPSEKTIQIISTSIVEPAALPPNTTNHHDIEIQFTPFDIQFLPLQYAQRGLLFPNPSPQKPNSPSTIPRLKTTLSRALSIVPPFAGRLAAVQYDDDGTASFSLNCNGAGALVVHAVANGLSAADILHSDDPTSPGVLHSLFSMNGAYGCEGVSKPLLVVQFTQLADGFFMGFTFSHAAADGSSFWHFLSTWSEISRNTDGESVSPDSELILENPVPVIGTWFLDGIEPPIRFPFSFDETIQKPPIHLPLPPLLQRIFHFSKDKIAQLKYRANSEQTDIGSAKSISSFQSMLAHIWRAVIRNSHGLDPDEEVYCKLLVDFRQRLRPKLPEAYFGNAVLFATATATAGDLVEKGIGFAALKLNETVERQTDGEGRRWVKEWMEKPEVRKLGAMARNSLIVADSPRFEVYGNDFGWGKPVAVRAAGNYSDGKLTVLKGKEEGSVDVQICLMDATMKGIGNDSEFMEFVG